MILFLLNEAPNSLSGLLPIGLIERECLGTDMSYYLVEGHLSPRVVKADCVKLDGVLARVKFDQVTWNIIISGLVPIFRFSTGLFLGDLSLSWGLSGDKGALNLVSSIW